MLEGIPKEIEAYMINPEENCGTKESENKVPMFVKAATPTSVLPHSLSTPSLAAQVMYQKFAMGLPFNRQEQDWFRLGLVLPRRDVANWTIRCSEEWLQPIYNRIHEKIAEVLDCKVEDLFEIIKD